MASGLIPEEEDQEMYDDIGIPEERHPAPVSAPPPSHSEPIDEDIYEELPGNSGYCPCWTLACTQPAPVVSAPVRRKDE
ncbi:hypothetical protein JZ751_009711 [Albula glossodonta]|uniref:Uncharacterized protein n=1 Tax=Albula glossodonta TaxID=121402 RepID=A0A8T2P6K1_9TELE|nr:hypothetical protein JZ751_009711 [Albula glossodonta]